MDVITGGSPCQDLSVAGKRAGLDGERSGLFMEQIRIVKEMRERDRKENGRSGFLVRPRYMVWENVPGAFSSNGGKDFQAVLSEIVRIADPQAPDVPMPDRGGWSKSGCLYDQMGKWSVAWRVHDAQFWGVPQRRKRIALVADFGGLSAPEILFVRKGLQWNPEPGIEERERTAARAEDRFRKSVFFSNGDLEQQAYGISGYASNAMKSPNPHSGIYKADTSRTLDLNGGSPACNQGGIAIVEKTIAFEQNQREEEKAPTLSGQPSALEPTVLTAAFDGKMGPKAHGIGYEEEKAPTLKSGGGWSARSMQ